MKSILIVLAILLAGCSSPAATDSSPHTVTDPEDFSYLDDPNMANQEHLHDYWHGEEVLEVLNQERNVAFSVNGGTGPYMGEFTPNPRDIIPLGTRNVTATVTFQDVQNSFAGAPEFWVKTAQQKEPEFIAVIQSGETMAFEVPVEAADLPHQSNSAWRFYFAVPAADQPNNPLTGQAKSFNYRVNMTVSVERGWEIPLFPAHPDYWNGSNELTIVESAVGETFLWTGNPPACGYCSGGIYEVEMDEGAIVPSDAKVVRVSMDYEWETPTGLMLLYHGATNKEFIQAPLVSDDGATRLYEIDVGADGDGAYTPQSLWRFYFKFDSGDGPYRGSWALNATAILNPLAN